MSRLLSLGMSFMFFAGCSGQAVARYDSNLSDVLKSMNVALVSERSSTLPRLLEQAQFLRRVAPNDPRVLDMLGCVYFRMGDLHSSRRHFEDALRLDPAYARATTNLGILEFASGDLVAASQLFASAIEANPAEYQAYRYAAEVATRLGENDLAQKNRAIFQMLAPTLARE